MFGHNIGNRINKGIVQGILLVCIGLISGFACNTLRPGSLEWVGDWSPAGVYARYSKGIEQIGVDEAYNLFLDEAALFLDARDPFDFESGHIPGAINVSPEQAETKLEIIRAAVDSGKEILAYCGDIDCHMSMDLALAYKSFGIDKTRIVFEGLAGWLETGCPLEEGIVQ